MDQTVYVSVAKYISIRPHDDLTIFKPKFLSRKYDLYTKSEEEDDIPDIEKLKPYYQQLIDQYCPGVLKW